MNVKDLDKDTLVYLRLVSKRCAQDTKNRRERYVFRRMAEYMSVALAERNKAAQKQVEQSKTDNILPIYLTKHF